MASRFHFLSQLLAFWGEILAAEMKEQLPLDLIQVEAWKDEDEENGTNKVLGPANLLEAAYPLYLLTGKKVQIIVNERYSLGEEVFGSFLFPIQRRSALLILMLIDKAKFSNASFVGSVLVSDGYTNHVISPQKASWEESFRLYYSDPWGDVSFLQEGRNIAGVRARSEGDCVFSLSYAEYEKVIVAIAGCNLQSDEGISEMQTYHIINQEQPLSSRENIPYEVFLSSQEIVEYVRRSFLLQPKQHICASIFDGQKGRATDLIGFDRSSDSFLYRDPRGEDPFFQRENRQMGIAAEPIPDQLRISRVELESVIHSVTFLASIWAELRGLKYRISILQGKIATQDFDIFLCHQGQDKPAVKQIGEQLKLHGILPWLDQWELRPGLPWQRLLEEQIAQIKTAAVFVGKNGLGPWQHQELDALLREFVRRDCPVIPVLLADAPQEPALPVFLKAITWVDFRTQDPDPMQRLLWGITGRQNVREGTRGGG